MLVVRESDEEVGKTGREPVQSAVCERDVTGWDAAEPSFAMGNGMNKVLPGLYVGNYRDSKDASQLDRYNISHIVAIHDAARKLHSDKHYLCVMAADTPDQNLTQYFPLCNDFIHAARLRGGNVLIHCLAGMSRSVTVAVAYIMSVTSLNWKEALKVVRVGRSVANPNFGFQKQLQEFEIYRLAEERRRLKERFPSLALAQRDEEECRIMLNSYQGLLLSKDLCEGKCAMGEICPTGLCRSPSKRILRRKSSTTPPQSPRLLPPTPTSHSQSSTSLNMVGGPSSGRRPRSGPGGLSSYTCGSAPQSRSASRFDLTAVPGSSPLSRTNSRQDMLAQAAARQDILAQVSTHQDMLTQLPSRQDMLSQAALRQDLRHERVPLSAPSSPQHFPRRPPPLHELDS